MCMRKLAFFALACALPVSAVLACGPDFPQNLLDDRKASLLDLPDGSFAFEAAHLLPKPDDHLRIVEGSPWDDADEARATGEAVGLSTDEVAKVKAMRAASGQSAAAAAGEGLAPELLDYTLGALAFKAGDMAMATTRFRRVLALSPVERPRRGLWAQYMLARAQLATGNTDSAVASFEVVRQRAKSGAADPLGLAVASYGEQARMRWHRGNIAGAVALYAQQAAHGSSGGTGSLLFVTRSILAHPDMLERSLDDPLTQRLLAAYYYTRTNEFATNWPAAGSSSDADTGDGASVQKSRTSVDVEGFLAAVQRHGLDHFDGADRLAAGAYRAGRYPLAAQLAAKSTTPLAAWVRAKLALRAGNHEAATNQYALAAKGFPVDESWSGGDFSGGAVNSPLCRVETERGVFALSRGDYVEAMARMYAGAQDHWPDAAYVAERVLTLDELKDFVDKNSPVAVRKSVAKDAADEDAPVSTPSEQIRALLARRLLREGRDDAVLAYIDDPKLRAKAAELLAARRASNAWKSIDRAAALYKQAQLTRADGMDLIGTELAPDYAIWDGEYLMDGFELQPPDLVAHDEHVRLAASAVAPDQRYHYRYVAADLAEQAARLVPARSQAYAAMMCQATGWMLGVNSRRAEALYHRYLREGAWVRWGKNFGHSCPQPDFRSASSLPWKQRYWAVRHFAKRAWPYGLGLFVVGTVVLVVRRRRRSVG